MISLFKRGMGMVFLMIVTFTHAQITTANNGLNATGSDPNKTVGLGGTLLDAQAAIDFNSSFSNSSFLLKKGSTSYFSVNNNGTAKFFKTVTLGDVYPNAPNEHVLNYMGDQYPSRGIKVVNNYSGSIARIHSLNEGLYVTKDDGSPSAFISENFSNASDGSTLRATFGRWEISGGIFTVNQWWTGNGQYEMTIGSASRKGMIIKSAASQTANLTEWQDNSGTALSFMNSAGALSIGNNGVTNSGYKLNVNGNAEFGDSHDPTGYGLVQIVRPSNQPDDKFHLSFIRNGVSVAGIGYARNSTVLGIWHHNDNSIPPTIGMTYDQKVGIGVFNPAFKLDMDSPDNDGGNGDTRFRLANTSATGNNSAGSRPTIEVLGARGDGNISFEGKLALGTRRTDGNALNNQTLGAILFGGQHGIDQTFQSSKILYPASIQGVAEGTFSNATTMPTGIAFLTSSTGDAAGAANLSYGTERMRIGSNGSVGIGTTKIADAGYKLFVETGIRTRKVKVDQAVWSDFVFEKDYLLPTLNEVEQFIQSNKHLPGVPSTKEVQENGLNLGDNQAIMLQKIEELTLYMIEQNKRINAQQLEIEKLQKEITTLKK